MARASTEHVVVPRQRVLAQSKEARQLGGASPPRFVAQGAGTRLWTSEIVNVHVERTETRQRGRTTAAHRAHSRKRMPIPRPSRCALVVRSLTRMVPPWWRVCGSDTCVGGGQSLRGGALTDATKNVWAFRIDFQLTG